MSQKYEHFGKYVLLDKVAAGGMAEVYRAKAPGAEGIGKILAIKRILPQYNSNSEFIEMFKSEAKIAINLTQGNIAQIYEFGEDKSLFFLLMEYIDGRNLRQVLSRCAKLQKALTIEQCVFIIGQVASGLDYAHRCLDKNTGGPLNIIHRDMSPQNIMISFEGEVKIIDFGIAKAESKIENTRAGTLKGKFGYMSPEQAEGFDLDARTDIFSTGIVLWELLSGERLFIANNEVNTIRKIKECQIPSLRKINPNIHEELERISLKALAKDRNLRYQTAAELHRDLSRFLYKVNPEFTSQDLAGTIKSLFKDDILEDRKKSLEYAKITLTSQKEEKTVATSDNTKTMTATSESTATTKGDGEAELPKNLVADSKMKVESIDFSGMQNADVAKNFFRTPNNSMSPDSRISLHTPSKMRHNTATNFTGSRILKKKSNPAAKWTPMVFVVGVMAATLYFLTVNPKGAKDTTFKLVGEGLDAGNRVMDDVKNRLGYNDPNRVTDSASPDNQYSGNSTIPRKPVYIHSVPPGAQVEIDGAVLGTTPLEVQLAVLHKTVTITMKRDGYLTYNKEYLVLTDKPDDLPATLQKAIVGYVNVDVAPSFADLYINGQKIAEKPPISRYAIPADRPVVIKALNPYTNTSDQATVTVKQDTVQDVKLFLHGNRGVSGTSDN